MNSSKSYLTLLSMFSILFANHANSSALVRVHSSITKGQEKILTVQHERTHKTEKILRKVPYYLDSGKDDPNFIYIEKTIAYEKLPSQYKMYLNRFEETVIPNSEVRTLIEQGPSENRIKLTIVGDGYTLNEKEKFFSDTERTVKGLFEGKTFASYLPLFSIKAVFVPSTESGIGDGSAKNTAFKLYRSPAGSKRAIMPGDESAIERALKLSGWNTDYPIVLANDDFYGGLGGRYAISTRSVRSGLLVLRHELGHNFGQVGEEYDNGSAYFGANNSGANITWSHWIDGELKLQESKLLSGNYVWQNLDKRPYQNQFKADSQFPLAFLSLSSVGWDTTNDVDVNLNGNRLTLNGGFHNDRAFYDIGPVSLLNGLNTLTVKEVVTDKNNVLGFALVYAMPKEYDFTPNKILGFATYRDGGAKSYRPTHNSCLMRNMEYENFCSVDKENMWYQFLSRISLIDSFDIKILNGQKNVIVTTLKLNGLSLNWFKHDGTSWTKLPAISNQFQWIASDDLTGRFKVSVEFKTPEVRKYNTNFKVEKEFQL